MVYEAIIGLEIHAELKSETKLFCACKNEFGASPNSNCCPVCTGMPGTLPVPNKHAIELAVRAGVAFGCKINRRTMQYRKHYFYPDLPKGYQISQYAAPFAVDGVFEFRFEDGIKRAHIRQIHIEEDAGKLVHMEDGVTCIDYNRAGVPLIELVTEPEFRSAAEARAFLEAVRIRLMHTGISDCKMEQGSLRCDVNVSLREQGSSSLGERVEMKNINTFSGAERAIENEIQRQTEILSSGGKCVAETRKWDDEKRQSSVMRAKENAMDYKFIPEPDIPCYEIDELFIQCACKNMPETEISRFLKYCECGVLKSDAETIMASPELSEFFDKCICFTDNCTECAKLLCGEIAHLCTESKTKIEISKLLPEALAETVRLLDCGEINRDSAKKMLKKLFFDGGNVCETAKAYTKISDEAKISECVATVIRENGQAVYDYLSGRESTFKYLMGMCMKKLRGRADAEKLSRILKKNLDMRCE